MTSRLRWSWVSLLSCGLVAVAWGLLVGVHAAVVRHGLDVTLDLASKPGWASLQWTLTYTAGEGGLWLGAELTLAAAALALLVLAARSPRAAARRVAGRSGSASSALGQGLACGLLVAAGGALLGLFPWVELGSLPPRSLVPLAGLLGACSLPVAAGGQALLARARGRWSGLGACLAVGLGGALALGLAWVQLAYLLQAWLGPALGVERLHVGLDASLQASRDLLRPVWLARLGWCGVPFAAAALAARTGLGPRRRAALTLALTGALVPAIVFPWGALGPGYALQALLGALVLALALSTAETVAAAAARWLPAARRERAEERRAGLAALVA